MHTGIPYEHIHIYKDNLNINLLSFVPFVSPSSLQFIYTLQYNRIKAFQNLIRNFITQTHDDKSY